jgi:two-component system response regulator PilR (NtrC family)
MELDALCAPGSPMNAVLDMARVIARRTAPVLLLGESGTGKEVVANLIHRLSPRAGGPFVAVNCAAISATLIESELFGHRKGAFTHALSDRPGCIRKAHGGTLFLDEIGDMPGELQARFLRVLQEKKVRPVGADEESPVDFRLVCATHRDLAREVEHGRFRADLYYRLQVLELRLPPLRDRRMDIPFLLEGFLREIVGPATAAGILANLPAIILTHAYPGNVRELRNLAERYLALREMGFGWERAIAAPAAPPLIDRPTAAPPDRPLRNSRWRDEDVLEALKACDYHRGRAAEKLGITRRALQYRLERLRGQGEIRTR